MGEMKSALFLLAVGLALSGCTSWQENNTSGFINSNIGWNRDSVVSQQVHRAQLDNERKLRNRRKQRQHEAQEELLRDMDRWQDGRDELFQNNSLWLD